MKRFALLLGLLLIATPALAQSTTVTLPAVTHAPASIPADHQQQIVVSPAPAMAADAVIHTGDLGGQVLQWVAATFGSIIGTVLTAWLLKLLKNAGIQGSELLRDRLQNIIVNGLNAGAKAAAAELAGKGDVEVKNAVVAKAITYTQEHGADTLKALGIDPTNPKAVEAIKARIETAINDPSAPTPPVLGGPEPVAVVSPKAA